MSRVAAAWNEFWFTPTSIRRLGVARIVIVAVVVFDLVVDPNGTRGLVGGGESFWRPDEVVLVRALHLPRTPQEIWTLLWLVLVICALLALVGLATRASLCVLLVGYTWWVMSALAYGFVGHGRLMSVIGLFALALGPSGRAVSLDAVIMRVRSARAGEPLPGARDALDPLAGWALRFIGVALVLAYTSAAYAKIRTSGFDWPFDGAMDAALLEQGTWLAHVVDESPTLVHLMALAALVWEATAFVLLIGGRARDASVVFGIGFHVSALVLLEVNFLDYAAAYVVFYRLEDAASYVGDRVQSWAGHHFDAVEVRYDGLCGLCVKAVTFLHGIDWLRLLRPVDGTAPDGSRLEVFEARSNPAEYEGFLAYRRLARAVPLLAPLTPLLYVPGVPQVGERLYQRIAAKRGSSCSITAGSAPAPGSQPSLSEHES
jgi:hypothetical protein